MASKKKPAITDEPIPNVILPKAHTVQRMNVWVGGRFERTLRDVRRKRRHLWLLWSYVAALLVVQVLIGYSAMAGLALSAVLLAALIAGALLSDQLRKVTMSLAIIPLADLIYACFMTHSALESLAILAGTFLLLGLIYRYLFLLDETPDPPQIQLANYPIAFLLVLLIGFLIGVVDYLALRYHYAYGGSSQSLVLLVVALSACAETLLFQGLIQHQIGKLTRPVYAALITAALTFGLTVDHSTIATVGPALLGAIVLPALYYMRQNVLFCMVANLTVKLTYVILVSTYILR